MAGLEVLALHGAPGSGKTTLARVIAELLRVADVPHAVIDLDELSTIHPDQGRAFARRNLAAIWPNFAAVPQLKVVVPTVLADEAERRLLADAVPGARLIVCELTAPEPELKRRVTAREPNEFWQRRLRDFVDLYCGRTDLARIRDFVVSTHDRSEGEAAAEVVARAGWATPSAGWWPRPTFSDQASAERDEPDSTPTPDRRNTDLSVGTDAWSEKQHRERRRYGRGVMQPDRVTTPYEGLPAAAWDPARPVPAPLRLHETPVRPEWLDYNGHMTESAYLLAFGDSADAFFRYVGIDEAYRAAGRSVFTAETHLHHLGEARDGDRLALSLQLLGADAKRLHVWHELTRGGELLATAEQLLLSVDTGSGRVAPFPAGVRARVDAVAAAHAGLPRPPAVGHVMGIDRKEAAWTSG